MKTPLSVVFWMYCACVVQASVTFEAYEATTERRLFVVSIDKARTSGWLAIGQEFDGVLLESFDTRGDLLTVSRDGVRFGLRLADSHVRSMTSDEDEAQSPIIISTSDGGVVAFEDDITVASALRARFTPPAVTPNNLYVVLDVPRGAHDTRVVRVLDLLKSIGVRRVSFKKNRGLNRPPEPRAVSVTAPPLQQTRQP